MKALLCTELGPASRLSVAEVEDPTPGTGEVLIAVEAAGLNFPDTLIIQGLYQVRPELPFSPGGEGAGVVAAVGDGVLHVSVGDRVIAMGSFGAFADKWVVPASTVMPMPDSLDSISAAGLAYTYGTSYHALLHRAEIQAGETLLVLGAAGGVGSAAVELGKHFGATVIAAASTGDKLAFATELGADHVINYSTDDLRARIKEITDGRGVDVVYDPVGGEFTEAAFRSLAWKGRHLVIGFAAGDIPSLPINLALLKGASLVGVFWGRWMKEEPATAFASFSELARLVESGAIHPRVSDRFSLHDYEDAFAVFANRSVKGKAVFVL